MSDEVRKPIVGIVMGSYSDFKTMKEACDLLNLFGIPYEVRILSAHRTPEETSEYARQAAGRGLKVLIAGAGWAAHLAGFIASQTPLPVIGIPLDTSPLKGIDALLATVQMPPGVPVATMAIGKGGVKNAALFAIRILALQHPELWEKLEDYKRSLATQIPDKELSFVSESNR